MTPNQKLAISVVIPYYNGSRFIAEALASVRAQTLAPLEVIVVDDCSRPDEAAALDREAHDCVVIHLPKNRGPSVARNIGIARARGEWIAFLDCDDLWAPRKLELQAAVVAANADCRAVHCGMTTILPGGKEVVYDKGEVTFEDFLEFPCPIFPSAVLMQRQALFECGLFDPTKRCCEDLDLFLRFCYGDGKFYVAPEPLMIRRIQDDGLSRNLATFWREADRVYRDFLPVFADRDKSRATLRSVHADMTLRALYARDFKLMWRRLRDASQRDVPMSLTLSRAVWQAIRNRLR
ncbi:MAG TPA: glycosyltransferase family A protein [Haliangiales bacterium]|nr:glycosyltransferase family A protein [Haliangiales bacterium]